MNRSVRADAVSVLLAGVVLAAQLYAPGLLCVVDDATDCCPIPQTDRPSSRDTQPFVDRGACDCCIAVEALPASVRVTGPSVDLEPTAPTPIEPIAGPNVRVDRATSSCRLDAGLASLRTIVLLV